MAEPEEEIEFAERAKREPERTRRLRHVGAGLAFASVVLCLFAIFGDRWWSMDVGGGRIYFGGEHARICDASGNCEAMRIEELDGAIAALSNDPTNTAAVRAWSRSAPLGMLGFVAATAGLLGGIGVIERRHKGTRVAAVTAGVFALLAMVPCWRFVGSAPIDLLHRGVHAYLGVAGILSALVAAALVAIPPALVTPPTARVVRRG
jgi:hypothetical protein